MPHIIKRSSSANIYYAISKGHGVTNKIVGSWDECKKLVSGCKGAKYKKFITKREADEYILDNSEDGGLNRSPRGTCRSIISPVSKRISNDDTEYVNIYTDGSLIRKHGGIYAGYGIYMPGKHFEISRRLTGKKTNNRAELMAIISAIKTFKDSENTLLCIYTDSAYSIGIFGSTGTNYRNKNYMKNSTTEVPNADLVKVAVELADIYMLKFTHINSHTSNTDEHSMGNDRADTLAVRGAGEDYINSCESIGDFQITFGKYKGHYIKNIPTGYLSWIISSDAFETICRKNEDRRLEKEIVMKFMECDKI